MPKFSSGVTVDIVVPVIDPLNASGGKGRCTSPVQFVTSSHEHITFIICHNSAPTFFVSFGFERRITEERVTSSVDGIGMQIFLKQADNRS